MKNKKSLFGIFLIGVAMFSMVGCSFKNKDKLADLNADNLNADNLNYVEIDTYEKDGDFWSVFGIVIDFDEGTMCYGHKSDLIDMIDGHPKVKELNEEQIKELKNYIIDYSYTVHDKEDDYWPDTDEYPDMRLLFEYDIRFGGERYKQDGALCYPDGWDEFIEFLREYYYGIKCK